MLSLRLVIRVHGIKQHKTTGKTMERCSQMETDVWIQDPKHRECRLPWGLCDNCDCSGALTPGARKPFAAHAPADCVLRGEFLFSSAWRAAYTNSQEAIAVGSHCAFRAARLQRLERFGPPVGHDSYSPERWRPKRYPTARPYNLRSITRVSKLKQ